MKQNCSKVFFLTKFYACCNLYLPTIWACGGMVDTLVLGTSAKAWEFESLHAQIKGNDSRSFFYAKVF